MDAKPSWMWRALRQPIIVYEENSLSYCKIKLVLRSSDGRRRMSNTTSVPVYPAEQPKIDQVDQAQNDSQGSCAVQARSRMSP